MTDRCTKAVEQLGSGTLDVRIGGIYALERIARDSLRDHPAVMDVLAAFIREHSWEQWPVPRTEEEEDLAEFTRPDIQAALTIIGRRASERDIGSIDLTRADLTYADLTDADLRAAKERMSPARAVISGQALSRLASVSCWPPVGCNDRRRHLGFRAAGRLGFVAVFGQAKASIGNPVTLRLGLVVTPQCIHWSFAGY